MLTKVGIGIGVAGWVFMLVGVGQSTEGLLGTAVELHKLEIAAAMIMTGGFTAVCGVIKDGVRTLIRNLA